MTQLTKLLVVAATGVGVGISPARAEPPIHRSVDDAPAGCDTAAIAKMYPRFCDQWRNDNWWKALQLVEQLDQPDCPFTYCYRSTLTARLLDGAKTIRETDQVLTDYHRCQQAPDTGVGQTALKQQALVYAGPLVESINQEHRSRKLRLAGGLLLGLGAATLVLSAVGAGIDKNNNGVFLCNGEGFTFDCTGRYRTAYGIGFAVSTTLIIGSSIALGLGLRSGDRKLHSPLPRSSVPNPCAALPSTTGGCEP